MKKIFIAFLFTLVVPLILTVVGSFIGVNISEPDFSVKIDSKNQYGVILENNSFIPLRDVKVYADYFIFSENHRTFKPTFCSIWPFASDPVATTTWIWIRTSKTIAIDARSAELNMREQVNQAWGGNGLHLIRIRVSYKVPFRAPVFTQSVVGMVMSGGRIVDEDTTAFMLAGTRDTKEGKPLLASEVIAHVKAMENYDHDFDCPFPDLPRGHGYLPNSDYIPIRL